MPFLVSKLQLLFFPKPKRHQKLHKSYDHHTNTNPVLVSDFSSNSLVGFDSVEHTGSDKFSYVPMNPPFRCQTKPISRESPYPSDPHPKHPQTTQSTTPKSMLCLVDRTTELRLWL